MKFSLPLFLVILLSQCAYAECYNARVRYEVLLPNAETPVGYSLKLYSSSAPGDSLSPVEYLIEWEAADAPEGRPSTVARGFSSYFGGNFFKFQNGKLLEYHAADNPAPFAPRGDVRAGVQQREQFADLLPQVLQERIALIEADTTYIIYKESLADGRTKVKGSQHLRGYVCSEFSYTFGPDGTPLEKEITTNPGQMGEQVITARYFPADSAGCPPLNEQKLMELYPEIFEKYRRDSFGLEKLRGEPLPAFTAQSLEGERFSHARGASFTAPTVIAVLDESVDATANVIKDLRNAIDALPFEARLILAFTGKDREEIADLAGTPRYGETVLTSARSLARDCGVTDSPSIIFCRPDGTVADIHVGRNNNLREIVIQKATLSR